MECACGQAEWCRGKCRSCYLREYRKLNHSRLRKQIAVHNRRYKLELKAERKLFVGFDALDVLRVSTGLSSFQICAVHPRVARGRERVRDPIEAQCIAAARVTWRQGRCLWTEADYKAEMERLKEAVKAAREAQKKAARKAAKSCKAE